MSKIVAILNVLAWAGFWAFGYIALGVESVPAERRVIAAVLAACGLVAGIVAYRRLVRIARETGRDRASNRLAPDQRERAQSEWNGGKETSA